MTVFPDSNVWVSAFGTRGLCADLMRALLRHHILGTVDLLVAEPVRAETIRILTRKFRASDADIAPVGRAMAIARAVPVPEETPPIAIEDPDDAPIVAAALSAGSDLFITGDHSLLALDWVGAMRIVSPRGAWKSLSAE